MKNTLFEQQRILVTCWGLSTGDKVRNIKGKEHKIIILMIIWTRWPLKQPVYLKGQTSSAPPLNHVDTFMVLKCSRVGVYICKWRLLWDCAGANGSIMGRDVSGAHTEASHPCFMMQASDFSRDALENRTASKWLHRKKNPVFIQVWRCLKVCSHFKTLLPKLVTEHVIKVLLMSFKLVLVQVFNFFFTWALEGNRTETVYTSFLLLVLINIQFQHINKIVMTRIRFIYKNLTFYRFYKPERQKENATLGIKSYTVAENATFQS